jgi:hypothetical protein
VWKVNLARRFQRLVKIGLGWPACRATVSKWVVDKSAFRLFFMKWILVQKYLWRMISQGQADVKDVN